VRRASEERIGRLEGADMNHRMMLGALASLCCWLWAGVAHGECTSPGFHPGSSNTFCNGCRYEGSLIVTHDQACERPYKPNPNGRVIEFLGNRVVQRAKHGIAGASGNTFAYQPTKGYVGPDDFVVEVAYRQDRDVGKFFVHFAVTVQ
jgi:hypothetical protein